MPSKTETKKQSKITKSIDTLRHGSHPFGVIDRCRPMLKPEFAVYDAIREAVPIVDAALQKIIRLTVGFSVECDNKKAELELKRFLNNVPSGPGANGIQSFISSYLDSLLMYGIAVGEMVVGDKSGNVLGLYNAPLQNLELKQGDDPMRFTVGVKTAGETLPVSHPERLVIATINASADHPEGRSLLDGLPFVTSVLLKIFQSVGTNFERIGNLRYAVTYKPSDGMDSAFGADRANEIAEEWSRAMSDKDGVRDFVAVGDVQIKVIGADNQTLDCEVPVRQMLEQIVAKTGIPPFLLGLSWSNTERMSQQQADVLTSELEYYRNALTQVIEKICRTWLYKSGYSCDLKVVWNDITLQDEVELARARLYRAQAEALELNNKTGGEK
jgi:hypothetical protein